MTLRQTRPSTNCKPNRRYSCSLLFSGLIAGLLLFAQACNDTVSDPGVDDGNVHVLVVNEGNWSDSNGSITRFNPESGQVQQEYFAQINDRPLGAIIQTGVVAGDRFFLVGNNSDKLDVLDHLTFESLGTVDLGGEEGITPAGFALAESNRGYVSSLYTNEVLEVDLETFELTGERIDVGNNPQDLLVIGDRLFVANNGFGEDNRISVINTSTNGIVSTEEVGNGPVQLVPDSAGRVWVVSSGYQAYDEDWNRDPDNDIEGRVDVLNGETGERIALIETGGFPSALALGEDRGQAWLVNSDSVQRLSIASLEVNQETFIGNPYHGISYSALENRLYLADNRGYEQSGKAFVYDMDGEVVDSMQTGVAPQEFHFQIDLQ